MSILGSAFRLAKNVGRVDANANKYQSPAEDYDFKNKDFEELAERNPALQYQYTPGWWDKIGNFFGFRTAEDKFRDEQYNKAADIDAQYMQLDREEDYNSAEEQAKRERMAGMNPNLTGNVDAGDASEFDNQAVQGQESPMLNQEQFAKSMNVAVSALGSASNILVTGMGLLKDVSGLLTAHGERTEDIYNMVRGILEEKNAGNNYFKPNMTFDEFRRNPLVSNIWKSKYIQKIAYNAFKDLFGGNKIQTEWEKTNKEYMEHKLKYDETLGKLSAFEPWRTENNVMGYDDTMMQIMKDFEKFNYEVSNAMNKYKADYFKGLSPNNIAAAENAAAGYKFNYFTTLEGGTIATAQNEQAKAVKMDSELHNAINGAFTSLMTSLAQKAANADNNVMQMLGYSIMLKVAGDIWNGQAKVPFTPPGLEGGMSSGAANALMQGAMGL